MIMRHAQILICRLAVALILLTECRTAQAESGAVGESKEVLLSPYARAYCEFLEKSVFDANHDEARRIRFSLAFIDDDFVPELLLFRDDSHAAGVEVYTCLENRVEKVGTFGSSGAMQYVERQGLILSQFTGRCETEFDFFRIEDGTARLLSSLRSGPEPFENTYAERYEIDGTFVTEQQFDEKWRELYDSWTYVLAEYGESIPLKDGEPLPLLVQAIEDLLWNKDSPQILEQLSRQAEVLAAYETILEEQTEKWENTGRFALIYLDDDDIPELAFIEAYAHIAPVHIYTFDRGEAVYVGYYGSEAQTAYWEKQGIIFNWFISGDGVFGVHQVTGAEDRSLQVFDWEWRCVEEEGNIKTCWVDGRRVTEEQYQEALQRWRDNAAEKVLEEDTCRPIGNVNLGEALREELLTLILPQRDILKRNLLVKSGVDEGALLLMDYDDYDGDGVYEAFGFCGKEHDYFGNACFSGDFWFVGMDQCVCLPSRHGSIYRKIDGQMTFGLTHRQKYLYYDSDVDFTANISGIWTVENGKPVAVSLPQEGQVVYRGDGRCFELWVDGYNHYFELQYDDMWTGHTWRPYFYHYDEKEGENGKLTPDEGKKLSPAELKKLCGFDLAGEVEAKGYEVTAIVRWSPSDIVTVNYTIPADEEDPVPCLTYENIIWDCQKKDYWRKDQRGVTSWENAGVGGSI